MKRLTVFALFTLLFFAVAAHAQCGPGCFFYGGDYDSNHPNADSLTNENDLTVPNPTVQYPVGAATYQNFDIDPNKPPVVVTGLFTNNMSSLSPAPTSAFWQICWGLPSAPSCLSGTVGGANFTYTLTGRGDFGYMEYHDLVILNPPVVLNPITATKYWFAVVPQAPSSLGRSFNSNSFGLNQVGTDTDNLQYLKSPVYTSNKFVNANTFGVFPKFSSGVCVGTGPC